MDVLISVIVPVYQAEAYLVQCVDSIVGQTIRSLEIILVDDGSSDRSPEICDEYGKQDARIHVIHKKNEGISAARNTGLDAAHGDYIAFVDSDDWIEADMLQVLVEACEQNHTDIAFCRRITVNPKGIWRGKQEPARILSAKEMLEETLMHRIGHVTLWDKLYRSHLFQDVRFPIGEIYEDEAVFYPLIRKAEAIFYTGTAHYYHRIREDSITHRKFSYERARVKYERVSKMEEGIREDYPELLPLMKYHRAYTDYEMLNFYLSVGGELSEKEEQVLRERFTQSFPSMLELWKPGDRAWREAVWIRLGIWDNICRMEEDARTACESLSEELRKKIDLENDTFTNRLFRREEYFSIERDLKKLEQLREENKSLRSEINKLKENQKENQKLRGETMALQNENQDLRSKLQELTESTSYNAGRILTWPARKLKSTVKRSKAEKNRG